MSAMAAYIPIPDSITPTWLTIVLRQAGFLTDGRVLTVTSAGTDAFNSRTRRLQLHYSNGVSPGVATRMILKRNVLEPWGIEAGIAEVKFYQAAMTLDPAPPALVPCYAAAYDPACGDSYLLLQDLSETHVPPITRDQQISMVNNMPAAANIEQVTETLAQHHAYWWNHPLLATETFSIGYWTRNADRFGQYLQRRQKAWESLRADEASWFPDDLRDLYEGTFAHLRHHWETYLEPRFRTKTDLTLIHADAYFPNFLCPKHSPDDATYLIDWQSPVIDIGGYDLANLCATFWTTEQRREAQRERKILQHYHTTLQARGVTHYTWEDLIADYQTGLIYWLLVPVQDRYDGSSRDYWWPKMQCLVAAFREWRCTELLGMVRR